MLWFIPTHSDNRFLGSNLGKRLASASYLEQVALAADALGYTGVLLPTGQGCEDSWVVASSLIPATKRLKFLIALRPGSLSVTLAARMAATFDRLSGGRLLLNIITGGDPVELAGDGTFLPHDERYAITSEFLQVWERLFTGESVTYEGDYLHIEGGQLIHPPVQRPSPPLYFGGSSPVALEIAARYIDLYLTHAEPPAMVAEKLAVVRALAQEKRDPARPPLRFGVRAHIIVREQEAEAWAAAEDLLRYADDGAIAKSQAKLARFDSVGQQRMAALHNGNRESLIVSPNLWAGVGLINKGIGTALVGNPEQVAARLQEYAELGADTFILSAYPHLEEAYRVAELVFPLLPGWNETVRQQDDVFYRASVPATWSA